MNAYKTHGVGGLIPTPPLGARRKLTSNQEQLLVETVSTKTPNEVGLKLYRSWNSKLVCIWVKEAFDVTYTHRGMRDMLIRLGFTYEI